MNPVDAVGSISGKKKRLHFKNFLSPILIKTLHLILGYMLHIEEIVLTQKTA